MQASHEEELWAVAQDPRTWRWMRHNGYERDEFTRWFASVDMGFLHYLDGELVGHTSFLNDRPEDRVVEIGNTWVHPSAFGSGANTEAKYLLLKHAFEEERYLRVEFKTDAQNERSRPALLGVGAQFEGIARKHMLVRGGQRRDSAWYAVIDDDWPEAKALLERRLGI
jgi:RimJ/RimL family protein N-acetyltransferase